MMISILVLVLLAFSFSLVVNVLSNLARIEEMKALKRELRKYEKAFASATRSMEKMNSRKEDEDPVLLIVKEETDDLPKFGDE